MKDRAHLAAIMADPDDDAPRSVYADLLQERGDPRGELIALQLAHAAGRVTRDGLVREHALLAKHGEAWAGAPGKWFHDHAFERGFFVGGRPRWEEDYAELRADPWWPMITRIDEVRPGLLDTHTRRARAWESELAAVAEVAPGLVDFDMRLHSTVDDADAEAIRICRGLPMLHTLTIEASGGHQGVFDGAPVLERITTLRITDVGYYGSLDRAAALVAIAAKARGTLRTLDVRITQARKGEVGWWVRFERDQAPGPFTRLRAWWLEGSVRPPKTLAEDCSSILAIAGQVRDVEIDLGRPMRLPPETVRVLVGRLQAFEQLERVQVPWKYEAPAVMPRWTGTLCTTQPLAAIATIWNSFVEDLGARFDTYTVNERGTPSLGKAPVKTLSARATAPKTKRLSLDRAGTPDNVTVMDWGHTRWSIATPHTSAELAAWFVRTVTALDATHAALRRGVDYGYDGFPLEGRGAADPGWLVALAPSLRAQLAPAARAAFLSAHPDVRFLDAPAHLVLQIGAKPEDASPLRCREVAASLLEAFDASVTKAIPAWFVPLVEQHIESVAKRLGYERSATRPLRVGWGTFDRYIVMRLVPHDDGWLMFGEQTGSMNQTLVHQTIDDEAAAERLVMEAAADLE